MRTHESRNLAGNEFSNPNQERSYGGRVLYYNPESGAIVGVTAAHCVKGSEIPTDNTKQSKEIARSKYYQPQKISVNLDQNGTPISELTHNSILQIYHTAEAGSQTEDMAFFANESGKKWLVQYLKGITDKTDLTIDNLRLGIESQRVVSTTSTTRGNSLYDSREQRARVNVRSFSPTPISVDNTGYILELVPINQANTVVPGISGSGGKIGEFSKITNTSFKGLVLEDFLDANREILSKITNMPINKIESMSKEELDIIIKGVIQNYILMGSQVLTKNIAQKILTTIK